MKCDITDFVQQERRASLKYTGGPSVEGDDAWVGVMKCDITSFVLLDQYLGSILERVDLKGDVLESNAFVAIVPEDVVLESIVFRR